MLSVLNILLPAFTFFYSVYILWQLVIWLKMPARDERNPPEVKREGEKKYKTTVSIIIPCRNEEKNIGSCLTGIVQQSYPASLTEIIVADDHSEDNTRTEAEKLLKNGIYGRHGAGSWKYVSLEGLSTGKKSALTEGINASKGELIIITDADCLVTENWVSDIVSLYEEKNYRAICGAVVITGEKNFCDMFQSIEVAGLSVLSGAGIVAKVPLLCNGANMAYTREAFGKVNGFKGISQAPSGDDTLLLFKFNKEFPGQIGFLKSRISAVSTYSQPSWGSFLQQRVRWASKSFISKSPLNGIVSFLVFITNFLLFVFIIRALVFFSITPLAIICMVFKFSVDFFLLNCATGFFKKRWLMIIFLPAELLTIIYVSWVGLTANFSGYKWKGRKYF